MKELHLDNQDTDKRGFSIGIDKHTMQKILIVVGVILILTIFAFFTFFAPSWFGKKKEGGIKTFCYNSSLISGKIEKVPSDLMEDLKSLAQKGTAMKVTFKVENGNSMYADTWEITQEALNALKQTNQMTDLFLASKPDLEAKITAYNEACRAQPFRAFVVAIDITEGFKGEFSFQKYLGDDGVQWLKDAGKQSSIFVYSIGYNPIPGIKSWENVGSGDIQRIEQEAQSFLGEIPDPLPSTKLLSQIHYIMGQMSEFTNPLIVIETDLLENSDMLSAYQEKSPAFKDFTSKKWSSYRDVIVSESGVPLCPQVTGEVKILLPKGSSTVFGKAKERHAWYSAVQAYLEQTYPKANFHCDF